MTPVLVEWPEGPITLVVVLLGMHPVIPWQITKTRSMLTSKQHPAMKHGWIDLTLDLRVVSLSSGIPIIHPVQATIL